MKTYLGQFPNFEENLGVTIHFHFTISVLWISLFIIQPMLIKKQAYQTHKVFGKASYFLFILILISFIPLFSKQLAFNYLPLVILTASDIVGVILFYALSIYNRKKVGFHMRYMIILSLVFAMPAIGRIFSHWLEFSFIENMTAGLLVEILILSGLIIKDNLNSKNYFPYALGLTFFAIRHLLIYVAHANI
ncbi:hypothetical protein [Flexithrix dorotheae]|uniref:hypothetical protein n=1 Tax=Flexithrix dorotheae TaxID=70993 RepID=UPI00039CA3EF|nr:hypothetical protein [Flexithrix dorotheae]